MIADNVADKIDITWEDGYRELWNALKLWTESSADDPAEWEPAWDNLIAVMKRHNDLKFVHSSNMEDESDNRKTTIVPVEDGSDSASMDGHLNKITESFTIGQLFSIPQLMQACSVVRSQAYNIKDYWEERGRIVQAKRGRYYWTT